MGPDEIVEDVYMWNWNIHKDLRVGVEKKD